MIHSLETCKISASAFATLSEWKCGDNPSYQAATRNKWKAQCCGHMVKGKAGPRFGQRTYSTAEWVARASTKHAGRYSYTDCGRYSSSYSKMRITCPDHGVFEQGASSHLSGIGCPKCGIAKQVVGRTGRTYDRPALNRSDLKTFIEKAINLHGEKYDYSEVEYLGNKRKVKIICAIHGAFHQTPNGHLSGKGCPRCAHTGPSRAENDVFTYVLSLCPDAEQTNRTVIAPKHIDIFIPSLKIGIEYNGLWQHSEACKEVDVARDYHQGKTYSAKAVGVRLVHIWEDEWLNNPDRVKAYLRRLLKAPQRRINARECDVLAVKSIAVRDFLNEHHIQGYRGGDGFALYHKGELVAVALAAGIPRVASYRELVRWCVKSDVSVIGGFTKVLSRFNEPLISYCDTAKHTGDGYITAGWTSLPTARASFHYVDGKSRINRLRMKERYADARSTAYPLNDTKGLTEREVAAEAGFYRIWGCDQLKFEWRPKQL